MSFEVVHVTDPACPVSWGAQPVLRRLLSEFADEVRITSVMGGLARQFDDPAKQAKAWLDAAATTGQPVDPRMWLDAPPKSSYPACIAVKAAAEQGLDEPYLRRAREAFAVEGRRLDNPDALVALAGEIAGMNVERFKIDVQSNAIVEQFAGDLDVARTGPWPRFEVDGEVVEDPRAALLAKGATSHPAPSIEDALRRFGRMTTAEVAAVCDLPGPRAPAELWRLALEWRVRPDAALSPRFWTAA